MRPFRSLLIFLAVVFLGGAWLGPALYFSAQYLIPGSWLAQNPFHRYMNRAFLCLALAGIWPLLRSLGATSWREVGIVAGSESRTGLVDWRRLGAGFALGLISLACVALLVVAAHGRQVAANLSAGQFGGGLAIALATGVEVALLEELLFRGALFGGLRRVWDWRAALLLSSMVLQSCTSWKMSGPKARSSGHPA